MFSNLYFERACLHIHLVNIPPATILYHIKRVFKIHDLHLCLIIGS